LHQAAHLQPSCSTHSFGTIVTPLAMAGPGASAGGLTEEEIFAAAGPGGSDAFHDADSGVSNDGSSEQEASMMRTSTAGSNSLQVRQNCVAEDVHVFL
jgi:hypothetical protein